MLDRQRKKVLDKQWNKRKPDAWNSLTHQRHREALYEILEPDEDIEQLISCHFGPDPQPQLEGIQSSPLNPQSGIAVATQNRLIFAAKGMFSKATDEVPFSNMMAISYRFAPTTAGDILPALITANINDLAHSFGPLTARCKIEKLGRRNMLLVNIKPRETVQPFVEYAQRRMRELNPDAPVPENQDVEPPTFTYDPLGDVKEQFERLQTLWRQGHISDEEMSAKLDEMQRRR